MHFSLAFFLFVNILSELLLDFRSVLLVIIVKVQTYNCMCLNLLQVTFGRINLKTGCGKYWRTMSFHWIGCSWRQMPRSCTQTRGQANCRKTSKIASQKSKRHIVLKKLYVWCKSYVFQVPNFLATLLHISKEWTLLLACDSGDDFRVLEEVPGGDCSRNDVQRP